MQWYVKPIYVSFMNIQMYTRKRSKISLFFRTDRGLRDMSRKSVEAEFDMFKQGAKIATCL